MLTGTVSSVVEGFVREGNPRPHVTVALQAGLLPVFENHPSVHERIPFEEVLPAQKVFDCSTVCAETEASQEPNIQENRTAIWARACGWEGPIQSPRIYFTDAEQSKIQKRRENYPHPIIGVGRRSMEGWRDYPYMPMLISHLSRRFKAGVVVVFDKGKEASSSGSQHRLGKNVREEVGNSLRDYFQKIAACDVVVSPDTAHIHVAGAVNVPIYGIFGPTDGNLRLTDYDVPFVLPRPFLACGRQPCWYKPCPERWCLTTLSPKSIVRDVERLLDKKNEHRDHFSFGSEL